MADSEFYLVLPHFANPAFSIALSNMKHLRKVASVPTPFMLHKTMLIPSTLMSTTSASDQVHFTEKE
tara:strand:- start:599 stop:799 length:201 start_codon:yes stop_codon:yes gene_type:complete